MVFVGLDTHHETSTCCVLDDRGQRLEGRTIKGSWTETARYLQSLQQRDGRPMAICYEASCGYGALHDHLRTFCQQVVVAHPGRVRLIGRSKRKNDRVDAQKLAKLLYLDEVPQVHVPSAQVRSWRELIELRRRQVQTRTRVQSRIRALLRTYNVCIPKRGKPSTPEVKPAVVASEACAPFKILWTNRGHRWLKLLAWPTPAVALRCELLVDELEQTERAIKRVTAELDKLAAGNAGVQLLCTIPGVGCRTAEAVVAYLDDPDRFARSNRVGSYAGLVPCQDSSGGTDRLGHITKEGPATMRWLLVQSAWQVVRREPFMRAYFNRVAGGRKENHKKALIATAHKLLRCMHSMLRTGEVWNPPKEEPAMAAKLATAEQRSS
jgi:transposase